MRTLVCLDDYISPELGARIEGNVLFATPERYRHIGERVDQIREYLGLKTIRFSAPDVGGLSLCCALEAIEIVDSALLTNPRLAHEGYGAFESQMQAAPPDLIATHTMWAQTSQIYDLEFFWVNYDPIVFENMLLWMHKNHIATLAANPLFTLSPVSSEFDPESLKQGLRVDDLAYLETVRKAGRPILLLR